MSSEAGWPSLAPDGFMLAFYAGYTERGSASGSPIPATNVSSAASRRSRSSVREWSLACADTVSASERAQLLQVGAEARGVDCPARSIVAGSISTPLLDLHPLLTDSVGEREPVQSPLLDADLPEEPPGLLLTAERLGELVGCDEASADEDLPHPTV